MSAHFTGHVTESPMMDGDGEYDEPVRRVRGISTTTIDTETIMDMIAGNTDSGDNHGVTLLPEEVLRLTKAESLRIVNNNNNINNTNTNSATSAPPPSLDPQELQATSEELFVSVSRTDSNENEDCSGETNDHPSVTLATEQVLQLTMNNEEDHGEGDNSDNNNPAKTPGRKTPKSKKSQRKNPKRTKSGSSTSSTGKLKKAVKKEKKSMEAVVAAAIRNYGGPVSNDKTSGGDVDQKDFSRRKARTSGKKKKQSQSPSKTKSGNSIDESCEETSARKKKKRGQKSPRDKEDKPPLQQQQQQEVPPPYKLSDEEGEAPDVNENGNNDDDEDDYDVEAPLPPQLSVQVSAMSFQSVQSIDRAGAIAVFPSESSHVTQRRSISRPINDIDFNQIVVEENTKRESYSRDLTSTNETYEEIPEPPESQIINATATHLHPSTTPRSFHSRQPDSSLATPTTQTQMTTRLPPQSVGSQSLTIPSAAFSTNQTNSARTHRTSTTQPLPPHESLSRDSSSENDEEFLGIGSLGDAESGTVGTVTAKAISSADYYAEVRRQLQREAVVAVDVIPLREDGLPLHNMMNGNSSVGMSNNSHGYSRESGAKSSMESGRSDYNDDHPKLNHRLKQPWIRNKSLWICGAVGGGILILALIIIVAVFATQRPFPNPSQVKSPTEAPSIENDDLYLNTDAVGDDDMSIEMLDMANTEMGIYWRGVIAEILPNDSLKNILLDPNYMSPHYMAYMYLVENAQELFGIYTMKEELTELEKSKVSTVFALVTLYYTLDGPNWFVNNNWLEADKDFCEWHGVNCRGDTIPKQDNLLPAATATDEVEISTPFKELFDRAPPGDLDDLVSVEESSIMIGFDDVFDGGVLNEGADNDLISGDPYNTVYEADDDFSDESWNGFFDDKIPIHSLDLQANGLVGTIPNEIGLLTNIYGVIDLSNNEIKGSIPTQLGMLSKLQCTVLHSNELDQNIPAELGSMTNLRKFDISGNTAITGSIPFSLKKWTQIGAYVFVCRSICCDCSCCDRLQYSPSGYGNAKFVPSVIPFSKITTTKLSNNYRGNRGSGHRLDGPRSQLFLRGSGKPTDRLCLQARGRIYVSGVVLQ